MWDDPNLIKLLIIGAVSGVVINYTIKRHKRKATAPKHSDLDSETSKTTQEIFNKKLESLRITWGKISKTLTFCFIKLPLILLAIAAVLAILAAPFYFWGAVGGMIIWTCILIILSQI